MEGIQGEPGIGDVLHDERGLDWRVVTTVPTQLGTPPQSGQRVVPVLPGEALHRCTPTRLVLFLLPLSREPPAHEVGELDGGQPGPHLLFAGFRTPEP